MSLRLPFEQTRFRSKSIQPAFILGTLVIQILILLIVLFQGSQINALAHKPAPSLVQLVGGRVMQSTAAEANYRSPDVLRRLTKEWATFTFNWSGKLPNGDPDQGMEVGNNQKVTTPAWAASFMLSEDFRGQFLKTLAQMTPQEVFGGAKKTVLQFTRPEPQVREIGPGQWTVDFVANLLVFDSNQPIGNPVKTNKRIYIHTVPAPSFVLPEDASEYEQVVYKMREAGVEIYRVEDLRV